jgi:hypothetical protein
MNQQAIQKLAVENQSNFQRKINRAVTDTFNNLSILAEGLCLQGLVLTSSHQPLVAQDCLLTSHRRSAK